MRTEKRLSVKTVKSTGSFLADNKKELLYLGGAVLLIAVGYRAYKFSVNPLSEALKDKTETVIDKVAIDMTKATISKQSAQKYAQQLLNACNGAFPFYGTDEALIKSVFESLKSGEDFKLVFNEFGQKNYNGYGSPPSGVSRHLDNYSPKDLVFWLRAELSINDGAVYQIVKERIESADWQF